MESTLKRFLRYLELERRLSPHTVISYQTDLLQFLSYCQETYQVNSTQDIQHFHVRSWMVNLLENGLKPRSVNRKLSSLKTFFKFELSYGRIQHDPMQKIISPKSGKRLPVVVRAAHLDRLFSASDFEDDFSGLRDRLMLELLYGTGMRRAELIGLKDSDIDESQMLIRIFGKGGKERRLPLLPGLLKWIKAYKEARNKTFNNPHIQHLLLTDKGVPLYPNFVYRKVKQYLGKVSTADKLSPHVLRHSFATHLTDEGADLNAIKELLGHASLAATQVYTHNSIEKLKAAYQKSHPRAKKEGEE